MGEDIQTTKPSRTRDLIGLTVFVAALVGCVIFFAVVGARYLEFYNNINLGDLPVPTELAIAVSLPCRHYWFLLIPVGALLAALPVWLARGKAWRFHVVGVAALLAVAVAEYRGLRVAGVMLKQTFVGSAPGYVGPDLDKFMNTVMAGVNSPNLEGRRKAVGLVGHCRKRAAEAVPLLAAKLKDDDAQVRVTAAEGLWRLTGEGKEALPVLLAALKSDDWHAQLCASSAFRWLGPVARDALPELRKMLEGTDEWSGREIKSAIEGIEHPDPHINSPAPPK